jgi:choline dehydrogenase-like flavoprotein
MIIEPSQLDSDELSCQVCIIGSGAAGIVLALELAKQRLDVVLVSGGGYEQSVADRKLYEGSIDPANPHEPLEENRHRAFGGGTKRWGGRLVPYEAIDLERRDFVPLSGWPIPFEDVASRFAQSAKWCELAGDDFHRTTRPGDRDLPDTLGGGAIETTPCERWSTPTDFGIHYRGALAAADNIRVLIDYHAVDLRLDDDLARVESVKLVSRRGRAVRVAAKVFILAAGGLENPRILLASRSQIAGGVGNHSDMVGRCYMSHLAGTHGRLALARPDKPPFYRFHKDRQGAYLRRRFRLSDNAQRRNRVMNVIGFPFRPAIDDPSHGDAALSTLWLQEMLRKGYNRPVSWSTIARHLGNIAINTPAAWWNVARQIGARARSPRLPFVLPHNERAQDALFFQAEQAPNPASRLKLSDEVDEFGMPRIRPEVRFSQVDFDTVTTFYRELDQALRAEQLGSIEYDERELIDSMVKSTKNFNSMAHHLGTTRMSSDPQLGVVDSDCRVHSVDNLYISGGSVFPTSGHANPTLTILALVLRLADHVAEQLRPAVVVDGALV